MSGLERVKRELEESIEVGLAGTRVDVIVMGPGLQEPTSAAKLRRGIVRKAREFGTSIEPEHEDLIAAAARQLGEGHSLTAYEIHLVHVSHLVVLIPASPGSLCELGLFSANEGLAHKLLILVDKKFPRSGSYVADGPLTIAGQYRAQVRHVDYDDIDAVWEIVRARLQEVRVERNLSRLMRGERRV